MDSNNTEPAVLGYFAGLLDGEGCVSIGRLRQRYGPGEKNRARTKYRAILGITNTDPRMTDWVKRFGGSVTKQPPKGVIGRKPTYYWRLEGRRVYELLRYVLPYLIIKSEQAKILFRLESLQLERHRKRTPLSPSEIAERESLVEALHRVHL